MLDRLEAVACVTHDYLPEVVGVVPVVVVEPVVPCDWVVVEPVVPVTPGPPLCAFQGCQTNSAISATTITTAAKLKAAIEPPLSLLTVTLRSSILFGPPAEIVRLQAYPCRQRANPQLPANKELHVRWHRRCPELHNRGFRAVACACARV